MRYIDADALIERLLKLKVATDDMYGMGIARGIERAETAIQMQPTADVVPKSEVEKLNNELMIWKQDRFNLYQRLELYEMARQKVAREIFKEIEKIFDGKKYVPYPLDAIAELKKKYAESENG